jgi:RNA polymerase sigma-70 factor (ECF subfamily)
VTALMQKPAPPVPGLRWSLVERAQAGDATAFGEIYREHADQVFHFVYKRVGSARQLAEDITSETFLRAWRRISTVTWQGRQIGAWLITIARNLVIDHYKLARSRYERLTADMRDAAPLDESPEGNPEQSVVDELVARQTVYLLRASLIHLTPEQRRVIQLRFYIGLGIAETAAAMGITVGACKALQYRAVQALGRILTGTPGVRDA